MLRDLINLNTKGILELCAYSIGSKRGSGCNDFKVSALKKDATSTGGNTLEHRHHESGSGEEGVYSAKGNTTLGDDPRRNSGRFLMYDLHDDEA